MSQPCQMLVFSSTNISVYQLPNGSARREVQYVASKLAYWMEANRRDAIFILSRISGIQLRIRLWQRRQRGGTEARIWHDPSWDDIRSSGVSNQTAVAFKLNPCMSFFTTLLDN